MQTSTWNRAVDAVNVMGETLTLLSLGFLSFVVLYVILSVVAEAVTR